MGIVPWGECGLFLGVMGGMRGRISCRVVRPQFNMAFLVRTGNRIVISLAIMVRMIMRRRSGLTSG